MDRFIAVDSKIYILKSTKFKIQYGQIYSVIENAIIDYIKINLKSSMDRFIDVIFIDFNTSCKNLKSSMDRFIGNEIQGFYFNKPI